MLFHAVFSVWKKPCLRQEGTMQFKCFMAILLWLPWTVLWIAETHFLGQIVPTVAVFDTVNAQILLNMPPNLDLTSNKHFAFLSVAQELTVGKDCLHRDRFFPESTALSFEFSSKLALFSRNALLSLLDVFFLSCDKQRKARFYFFFLAETCHLISGLEFLLRILWGVRAWWT